MKTMLGAAGFKQLGLARNRYGKPLSLPCWETKTCTFKSKNFYSKLDYMFLRDPHNKIRESAVTLVQPMVDKACLLTDHMGLRVDLTFSN